MSEINRTQITASVDGLRDRIAAALERADKTPQPFNDGPVGYEYLADAVIHELGLRQETSYGTTYPNVPVEDRRLNRYVTDWQAEQ